MVRCSTANANAQWDLSLADRTDAQTCAAACKPPACALLPEWSQIASTTHSYIPGPPTAAVRTQVRGRRRAATAVSDRRGCTVPLRTGITVL